jgi:hypothetical protein
MGQARLPLREYFIDCICDATLGPSPCPSSCITIQVLVLAA